MNLTRLLGMLIVTAALAAIMASAGEPVNAQGEIPSISALTLHGPVFISDGADPNGMTLTARIDDWESNPVIIGDQNPDTYVGLFIHAPAQYIGKDVSFWLEDQVQAD